MTNPSTKDAAPPGVVYDEAAIKRKLGAAIGLLAIFCVTYFTAAVIATRDFRAIGQIDILGMPLALYAATLVFIVGLVVTRMCLNQDKGD
ncbi:MAG: hypothetical protein M1359_08030 [Betaproteobacteria bacterium]|nr:hypothetical protein [Betaproteobacteria bacterium]